MDSEKIHDGNIKVMKIKNKFNPADLMTKHLSKAEFAHILEQLVHVHAEGRSEHAPELATVTQREHHGNVEDAAKSWQNQ